MHKLTRFTLGVSVALLFPLPSIAEEATDISVPHKFESGTPARAQDVNENFEALAGAINSLTAQVTALQMQIDAMSGGGESGPLTAASLVGKYWLIGYAAEHEGWGGSGSIGQFILDGEITLSADGSVTFQGNESKSNLGFSNVEIEGHQHLNVSLETDAQTENLSGTWTYSAGRLHIDFGDGGIAFHVSATGEVLVIAEHGEHGAIRIAVRLPK